MSFASVARLESSDRKIDFALMLKCIMFLCPLPAFLLWLTETAPGAKVETDFTAPSPDLDPDPSDNVFFSARPSPFGNVHFEIKYQPTPSG